MVQVKLPGKYNGKDLANAIEEVGKTLGYYDHSISHPQLLWKKVYLDKSGEPKSVEGKTFWQRLWIRLTDDSYYRHRIGLTTHINMDETYNNLNIKLGWGTYHPVDSIFDSDYYRYKSEFEKFIGVLCSTLEQKTSVSSKY